MPMISVDFSVPHWRCALLEQAQKIKPVLKFFRRTSPVLKSQNIHPQRRACFISQTYSQNLKLWKSPKLRKFRRFSALVQRSIRIVHTVPRYLRRAAHVVYNTPKEKVHLETTEFFQNADIPQTF